jgi:hypothetical protein
MSGFIAFILNLIGFGLIAMMVVQGLRKTVDFLCYRNIYLVGFIVFQVFSAAAIIASQNFGAVTIERPRAACTNFLLYTVVFLTVFLLSYHRLNLFGWVAGLMSPKRSYKVNDWLFLMAAAGVAVLAVAARLFLFRIPGVNFFVSTVPIAPLACAMVGWVWGGRRLNIAVVLVGGAIVLTCLLITMFGIYGRRPLVAACMALMCGAYFRMRLTMSLKAIAIYLTPIFLGMIFLVGSFSLVRGMIRTGASPVAVIQSVFQTRFKAAFNNVAEGTPDAVFTIWALDAFPQRVEPRPFFSLKYFIYHPIPRDFWDEYLTDMLGEKPVPLSLLVAEQARIRGVAWGKITLPPGVIGYAQAEGGFITLLVYALFFSQFCRFFDEIIRRNPSNPFMLLAVICALGDLVALPRGDIAIFSNLVLLGFIGDWFMLLCIRLFIGQPQETRAPAGYYYNPMTQYAVSRY